jgi:predicted dehydrogenase
MREAAERKGVRHAVGLQGQVSPSINYVKDMIAEGYVGKPLSATLFVNAANWGATLDRSYQASFGNGANLMTITGGHNLDALCYCLGEFRELFAFAVSQRGEIPTQDSGVVAKDVPDQLVVSGVLDSGAVVSVQVRGGMARGNEFMLEIHGSEGDLSLNATMRASTQRQELTVKGGRGGDKGVTELEVPAKYRWVPETVPPDSPYNVGQLYRAFGKAILDGSPFHPSFNDAVTRHRMLDAIVAASCSGQKQAR